jgi:hypothetical protein
MVISIYRRSHVHERSSINRVVIGHKERSVLVVMDPYGELHVDSRVFLPRSRNVSVENNFGALASWCASTVEK